MIPFPVAPDFRDACPECFPGDVSASLPLVVTEEGNGSLCAAYRCAACGHSWFCWWSAEATGWPVGRAAA